MELTPQVAFKYGFLLRCLEDGCNPQQIEARVKTADAKTPAQLTDWKTLKNLGAGTATAFGGLKVLLGYPAFIGAGLGAGGALALHHLTEPTIDTDEVKRRELIATYNHYARQAQLNALGRKYRPETTPTFVRM
jgi:hypothetical protein